MTDDLPGRVALCLLRHAHAADRDTWLRSDDERPLTERGRRQAEDLGNHLAGMRFAPDAILTSPLVRARETAEIVAGLLGVGVRLEARLGEALDRDTVTSILADAGNPRRPILVGHDPDFSELATWLVGAPVPLRKGAFARIDVELPLAAGTGVLRWLLPPEAVRA